MKEIKVGESYFIIDRSQKVVHKCVKESKVYFGLCHFREAQLSEVMDDLEIIEKAEQYELKRYGNIS
jgi:hypothetical protein